MWPPTKEMGGTLSLNVLPKPEEWKYCGFSFHILFGKGDYSYLDFIRVTGATVIPFCNYGNYDRWGDESHVGGYFLADDTPYDVEAVRGWYNKMKQKTSKPVGSIFWRPPHDADRNRLITISNFLDFILPYDYPYRDGRSLEATNSYIAYMINLARDLKCPVILGAQAMDDDFDRMADPGEVGVRNQYRQYYAAGIPIWWYSWTNKVTDVKRNYQHLMREWYIGEPLPYPCSYCPERFLTQADLDVHIASEHPTPPLWPAYQATGYNEIFMYEDNKRLSWFPNPETYLAFGYKFGDEISVPISWFYDKPIVESVVDAKTGQTYPAEQTPNYLAYREAPPVFTCPDCGATFVTQADLDTHIATMTKLREELEIAEGTIKELKENIEIAQEKTKVVQEKIESIKALLE